MLCCLVLSLQLLQLLTAAVLVTESAQLDAEPSPPVIDVAIHEVWSEPASRMAKVPTFLAIRP